MKPITSRYIHIAVTITLLLTLAALITAYRARNAPVQRDPLADWPAIAGPDEMKTPEELYAAALDEGILIVYTTSTRAIDVAASFEKRYPGLIVKVEHLREFEMYDALLRNYDSESFACDVIISADARAIMENEFLPKNIAVKYVPHDMRDLILPGNNEELLMLAGEAPMLQYNEQYYAAPPVNNWWELTEEKWRGMVYMPSPTRSVTTFGFMNMILKQSGEMAAAYEDLFGVPLELEEGETAGREFIRRLASNDLLIVNSSDEAAEFVGAPGSSSPYLGIVISSKTRLRDIGYEMVNHFDMEPFCGVYTPISVMMAGGSKNVNAAALFIRWILGEADGQGEGYEPYLQSGAWSVRSDVRDDTGTRSEELNLRYLDKAYIYASYDDALAFWEELMGR